MQIRFTRFRKDAGNERQSAVEETRARVSLGVLAVAGTALLTLGFPGSSAAGAASQAATIGTTQALVGASVAVDRRGHGVRRSSRGDRYRGYRGRSYRGGYRSHYRPYRYGYRSYYRPYVSYWNYGYWGWPSYPVYAGVPYDYAFNPDAGAIDLNIKPKKADVWVDGKLVGDVGDFDGFPRYLWLDKGEHHIVIHLEGYESLARRVEIKPGVVMALKERMVEGATKSPEELFAQLGPLEPKADEMDRGDDLYERREQRPDRRVAPPTRPRRAPSDDSWRGGTRDESLERERVERDQRQPAGKLQIDVEPRDAVVYLDGRLIGSGAELERLHSALLVDAGDHVLEVVRPGYRTLEVPFSIESGELVELAPVLEREDGDV